MLSVITCTHNPRPHYFKRVIEALRSQTLPCEQWEYIVIDNCSHVPIGSVFDLTWHPHLKIVLEGQLGLTPARLKGISESRGDIIVFVDDDNVLERGFLHEVVRTANRYPHLGSWSGQCQGEFEEDLPKWIYRYLGNLAIREFNSDTWSNLPRLSETMPCGAGMVVRRSVAQRYLELQLHGQRAFQLDRAGDSLLSGGDNDLAACACEIGFSVGLVASLKLTHLIPPERLTLEYQARLAEGIHFSSVILGHYYGMTPVRRSLLGQLADILRLLRLSPPHRKILAAAYRGRNRAVRQLTSI